MEHLAYSPNCRIIATSVAKTAFDEKRIVFRDAATGGELSRTQTLGLAFAKPPAFSRDGRAVLVQMLRLGAGNGGNIRSDQVILIDTATGSRLSSFEPRRNETLALRSVPTAGIWPSLMATGGSSKPRLEASDSGSGD